MREPPIWVEKSGAYSGGGFGGLDSGCGGSAGGGLGSGFRKSIPLGIVGIMVAPVWSMLVGVAVGISPKSPLKVGGPGGSCCDG